jgi:CheY-like chemotaxis protein
MKILVVDDNLVNQKYLYYMLKKNFDIETANNGLEAVDMLEKQSFDLVLMDLKMPVMDGAEATLKIRQSIHLRNKSIPIIVVTTNDFEHERIRCLACGADDYLMKPIDEIELLQTIDSLLFVKNEIKKG